MRPPPESSPASAHAVLERRPVGRLAGHFFVARYQRGYRWGETEVQQLLDDLWENRDRQYSLQPIVVLARAVDPTEPGAPAGVDFEWELVDGQQRLTTLYLLLQYLQRSGLKSVGPQYRLRYETRPDSAVYLTHPDEAVGDDARDNIDFFHIRRAWGRIHAWFAGLPPIERQFRADKLFGALIERVSVLWYQAPRGLDATALFTRLNMGRIPLTDAELVKAFLLTRLGDDRDRTLRAAELGAAWDRMERDLRHPDVWGFVSTDPPDHWPTRLSLLLDTLADGLDGRPRGRRPPFHTFDVLRAWAQRRPTAADPRGGAGWVWGEIVDLHALIMGWYEDRDRYHKIGFLVASGVALRVLAQRARLLPHSAFEAELDGRIRGLIDLDRDGVLDLNYEHNADKCKRVLLLANVEAVRRLRQSTERYPFRHHRAADGVRWSLEHIHAQQADGMARKEQWQAWLREHRDALVAPWPDRPAARDALVARIDAEIDTIERASFEALSRDIGTVFTHERDQVDADGLHGLGNLALLPMDLNSALSNAVFEVKRRQVVRFDREGLPVPICTRRIFLKYYTDQGARQPHIWGPRDRAAWLDALVGPADGLLTPYLTGETAP